MITRRKCPCSVLFTFSNFDAWLVDFEDAEPMDTEDKSYRIHCSLIMGVLKTVEGAYGVKAILKYGEIINFFIHSFINY